jgi:hypothetical protein
MMILIPNGEFYRSGDKLYELAKAKGLGREIPTDK